MIEILTDASRWFVASMVLAAIAAASRLARRGSVGEALCLAYGCMIAMMGAGHLVAVTILVVQGTLALKWTHYPIGLALVIPGAWLAVSAWRGAAVRRLVMLNGATAVALAVMGPAVVLAGYAVLNVVHLKVARPAVRGVVVAVSITGYLGMLLAALIGGTGDF
jgi:hypothetical protein